MKFPLPSVAVNPGGEEFVFDHLYIGVGAKVSVTANAPKRMLRTQRYITRMHEIKEAFIVPVEVDDILYVAEIGDANNESKCSFYWSDPAQTSNNYTYYTVDVADPHVRMVGALV